MKKNSKRTRETDDDEQTEMKKRKKNKEEKESDLNDEDKISELKIKIVDIFKDTNTNNLKSIKRTLDKLEELKDMAGTNFLKKHKEVRDLISKYQQDMADKIRLIENGIKVNKETKNCKNLGTDFDLICLDKIIDGKKIRNHMDSMQGD